MTARDLFPDAAPQGLSQTTEAKAKSEAFNPTPPLQGSVTLSGEAPAVAAQTCGTCGYGTKDKWGWIGCGRQPWKSRPTSSPCLIGSWIAQSPLTAAKREAQDGIDQAAAAADRAVDGWTQTAFEYVRKFAEANKGRRYTGHDIVQAAKAAGVPQPPSDKAYGAVIQKAARLQIIKRVGYTEDVNRHGNPIPLWGTT